MRTYEFVCMGCRKLVTETVMGYEACPEMCSACYAKNRRAGAAPPANKPPQKPKPPAPAPKPPAQKMTVRLQPTCPKCRGKGRVGGFLCPACEGSGVQSA